MDIDPSAPPAPAFVERGPTGSEPWLTPIERFRTHQALVDRLALRAGDVLLDLACGTGVTLATAVDRLPEIAVVGVDIDGEALATARAWLSRLGARHYLVRADLCARLPLADQSVDRIVCHDTLEVLVDPMALVSEAARVLRPGGVSVWSHLDFDSLVFAGGDLWLTRRVVHAYADLGHPGAPNADGQMGRKLAGLVRRSPLEPVAVDAVGVVSTSLAGPARGRLAHILSVLRSASATGDIDLTLEELERWEHDLRVADQADEFFYAHTAYVVTARRPVGPKSLSAPRP